MSKHYNVKASRNPVKPSPRILLQIPRSSLREAREVGTTDKADDNSEHGPSAQRAEGLRPRSGRPIRAEGSVGDRQDRDQS